MPMATYIESEFAELSFEHLINNVHGYETEMNDSLVSFSFHYVKRDDNSMPPYFRDPSKYLLHNHNGLISKTWK